MKLTKQKPKYPGDLIERHQKAAKKGKMPKESMKDEKMEAKLMKKGAAKKVAKKGKK
jgi:hypothetical protein